MFERPSTNELQDFFAHRARGNPRHKPHFFRRLGLWWCRMPGSPPRCYRPGWFLMDAWRHAEARRY